MKGGHIVLIIGAILLVSGSTIAAIWGVYFAGSFFQDNTIMARTVIDPGKSVDEKATINTLEKPVSVAIGVDRSGQPAPIDAKLKETVTDPTGKVVSENQFGSGMITSFNPTVTGTYTLSVTNQGDSSVPVSGTIGHLPFAMTNGKPDFTSPGSNAIFMMITGGSLAGIGVLTVIAGLVITILERRERVASRHGSATTEGGIMYRKD